ncbi:MFS transporter [Vibrio alfacsensis]|uniref:MFS transporter n=1 Tax=Vibrio alfacsensis TaxID=1074311 RepID=UPI002ADD7B0A|nr:MFS transporter [Vibrio alfacsensis]WQE75097.1 MFS transporter [Vibrio alfacsensis]
MTLEKLYSRNHFIKITIALCFAQFCIAADIATLAIATSSLIEQFQSNVDVLKLTGTVYPLVGASLMLTSGVIGLYIGWRRMLVVGLLLGLIGSLAKIVAPSIEWITFLARPLIGMAGVAILPACIALVIGHFPQKKHAQLFGLIAASTGIAAAVIPIASGFLIDTISWRSGFIVSSAFYFIGTLLAIFWIPPLNNTPPKRFDKFGTILSFFAMFCVILGLLKVPEWGVWGNTSALAYPDLVPNISPAFILILSGLILFVVFVKHEYRFDRLYNSALIPAQWFKNTTFLFGLTLLLIMYVIFGGLNFTLVAFLQVGLNLTATETGIIVLTFAASLIISSIATPMLFKQQRKTTIACMGFLCCSLAAGMTLISTNAFSFHWPIFVAMISFGLGLGMLSSQVVAIITGSVDEAQAERTGGIQATVRNIGLAMGITIIAGIGQFAMEDEIRSKVTTIVSQITEIKIGINQVNNIPYITDRSLKNYLVQKNIEPNKIRILMDINANARRTNFHTSMMAIMLFGVLGAILSMRVRAQNGA